jgi:hypothetical protein
LSKASSKSLKIIVKDGEKEIFSKLFTQEKISFGRSLQLDIPLEFEFVSRNHGCLTFEDGIWYLTDLKSSNGIFINNEKIKKVPVQGDFVFRLGKLSVQVLPAGYDDEITTPTYVPQETPPKVKVQIPPQGTATIPIVKIPSFTPNVAIPIHKPPAANPKTVEKPGKLEKIGVVEKISNKKEKSNSSGLLNLDFSEVMWGLHPGAALTTKRKLEVVVSWQGQLYDIAEFESGQIVTVGPAGQSSMKVPTLKNPIEIARLGTDRTQCQIPRGSKVSLDRGQQKISMQDLISSRSLQDSKNGHTLKIDFQDAAHIDLGSGMEVHLRYVPRSAPLPNWNRTENENAFKQSVISSAILHSVLLLMVFLAAPPVVQGPKLKNVPERFARLLVEKPKPKPTPPPPKPEVKKKEIVKKLPPPPKKVQKVVQKLMKPPKVIEKVNKFPMVVQRPVPKAPPPVKVENLGALAALGALSPTAQPNVVTNININKNAGGLPTKSMNVGGIVGALPSTNGSLLAGGGPRVKTKGMGYGTGTGYGVQGLKGTAGGRAVAGAVVGEPKLAQTAKVEGLTRAQVMAVVQKMLSEVQHCYERNLLSDANLSGRMEFEWDIAPSGNVTGVKVKRTTVNNGDGLGECVKGLFSQLRFPKASNGQSTTPSIGFPFGRL